MIGKVQHTSAKDQLNKMNCKNVSEKYVSVTSTLSTKIVFGATVNFCWCFWNGAALWHYSEPILITHFNTSSLHNYQIIWLTNLLTSSTSPTIDLLFLLFCHSEHCSPLPARIMLFDALRLWGIWLSISHFSQKRWLHTAVHRTSATTGRNVREREKMQEQSISL